MFVQDLFNISPGKKLKREHGIYRPEALERVGSFDFSSSSKDRMKVSRPRQYELVYDDNGDAVITVVQQDEGGAASSNVLTDVASSVG